MNQQQNIIEITQESELIVLTRQWASKYLPPMTIGLIGYLGAGKTTLVRHWVKSLGIEIPVSSPTYVLSYEYQGPTLTVEHWDLYRTHELPEELYDPPAKNTVRIVEWVDKYPQYMEGCDLLIKIDVISTENHEQQKRVLTVIERR